jgi:hypothetical protein
MLRASLSRLSLGQCVFAFPVALDLGLRFQHRLECAAAREALEFTLAASEFVDTFNSHLAARDGDLTLKCPVVTALVSVNVVEVAALRAFAALHVSYGPVGDRVGLETCSSKHELISRRSSYRSLKVNGNQETVCAVIGELMAVSFECFIACRIQLDFVC